EEDTGRGADRYAAREEGEGAPTLLLREEIRVKGIRGGDAARLADPDPHPRQEQLPEILGEAAGGGEQAPQGHRAGDDVHPALSVGEPGDRNGEAGIEK